MRDEGGLTHMPHFRRRQRDGDTALHLAARAGDADIVRLLYEEGGCMVDIANKARHGSRGQQALHPRRLSARLRRPRAQEGYTALHLAAISNHEAVMRFLIENGAKLHIASKARPLRRSNSLAAHLQLPWVLHLSEVRSPALFVADGCATHLQEGLTALEYCSNQTLTALERDGLCGKTDYLPLRSWYSPLPSFITPPASAGQWKW